MAAARSNWPCHGAFENRDELAPFEFSELHMLSLAKASVTT
jgi:hypothetical protein